MSGFGMFSWFSYQLPIQQRLQMIRSAGFDAVSLWWGDELEDKNSQPEMARKLGLDIDYVHAPCSNPNDLWADGLNGDDYLRTIASCISDCEHYDIPTVVMHITRLSSKPPITQIGLERMKRLVNFSEKKKINLALENLDSIQHLDYVYENIKSEYLGFCYDSGHEYFNHRDADCLSRYGNKLFAVHLDDNCGDDDIHLLPYDGDIKWDIIKQKLKECSDIRYLTLEVDFNRNHEKSSLYKDLSANEFLALAYERILLLK
ncbi:sugar phosphate isomerase/epimerase family protein [Parablautia muri]|nr:sugar phosphate isomerase/epimerase [Parablautia muri]